MNWLLSTVLLLVLVGCAANQPAPQAPPQPSVSPLRIGVAGHYPPVIFRKADGWGGIEIDLAERLAARLGRPLEVVPTRRDQLIPALLNGRFDIIMSGMTITDARKIRIDFSEPYLRSGLYALLRADDAQRYRNASDVINANVNVGVVVGTTGDTFLQTKMRNAARWGVSKPSAAPFELGNHRIDLFIHDAPSVMWLASEHESELVALKTFLDTEYLGWGIRRSDSALLAQVNAALAEWKADGSLQQVLQHWLPYQQRFF
jgi:polar amino acid transport system substrate-binding protein